MGVAIDPLRLTPEQRDKLEAYELTQQQLTTLQDIADMTQELVNVMDKQREEGTQGQQGIGALLADMRNSLDELKTKKDPEFPDFAKPVVDAINKSMRVYTDAVKRIDVKPRITVDAPQVNVDTPSVDLKGVEKAVAQIPKAFESAIKLIPTPEAPDNTDLLDVWEKISRQLESIETATRMKPQAPTTLKVTNPDGSLISQTTETAYATRIVVSGSITYSGKALPGSLSSAPVWQVQKIDETSGVIVTWADGNANFDNVFDDYATLNYS